MTAAPAIELPPMSKGLLQQRERADDVGLNKFAGAIDGSVDVALGGKMHHRTRLVFLEQRAQRRAVANILLRQQITRRSCLPNGLEVRGVGQLVDIDDERLCFVEQMPDHGGSDKPRTAGDEDGRALEIHA